MTKAPVKTQREEEARQRRKKLLEAVSSATITAQKIAEEAKGREARRSDLLSHIDAFYGEIDKLAKKAGALPASPLVVDSINNIVRDAKALVSDDPHLDRAKEFVPAGDPPDCGDVRLSTATVRAAIQRAASGLSRDTKRAEHSLRMLGTIAAALRVAIESGDDQPHKDDVAAELNTLPVDEWFFEADDGEDYFDAERLANTDLDDLTSLHRPDKNS